MKTLFESDDLGGACLSPDSSAFDDAEYGPAYHRNRGRPRALHMGSQRLPIREKVRNGRESQDGQVPSLANVNPPHH